VNSPVVGFAGLTHLALSSAVAMAEHGFSVLCFDPDNDRVEQLEGGTVPFVEPGFDALLAGNRERIRFSSDGAELARCALCYVAPDVATDERGQSDLGPLRSLLEAVTRDLPADSLLIVLSQVPPGFTRALDWSPDRLFYQVETLIFGRAVERALHPERYIVGCADPGRGLPPAYRQVLEAYGCPILQMRYESAELAKLSINLCLVATISAANTLAELCEQVGADWSEIVPALRLDRRIGAHSYIEAGLGIAGGNLERDLATVVRLGGAIGTDTGVVQAWQANSAYRKNWVLRRLHRELLADAADPVIGVLGLAYKPATDSVKNSPAVALIESLGPYRLQAFDPVASLGAGLAPRLRLASSALDACAGADALVVMTAWPEFAALDPAELAARMCGRLLLDPWGVFDDRAARQAGFSHHRLGVAC